MYKKCICSGGVTSGVSSPDSKLAHGTAPLHHDEAISRLESSALLSAYSSAAGCSSTVPSDGNDNRKRYFLHLSELTIIDNIVTLTVHLYE